MIKMELRKFMAFFADEIEANERFVVKMVDRTLRIGRAGSRQISIDDFDRELKYRPTLSVADQMRAMLRDVKLAGGSAELTDDGEISGGALDGEVKIVLPHGNRGKFTFYVSYCTDNRKNTQLCRYVQHRTNKRGN